MDELMKNETGGGVWLYGVTGWEDRKELLAMSALLQLQPRPLLSSTCSNTTPVSHDKLRPIQQTIIIHNVSHLTSHISHLTTMLTNIDNSSRPLFSEINKPVAAVVNLSTAVATLHPRVDFHSEKWEV